MNGILLIDKQNDWTSNDVVVKLKGILHERRIGHSGTLDPMATGLLVVFVGRATRAVEFAELHDKRYIAALRPGIVTDTQDTSGNVLSTAAPSFSDSEFNSVLETFKGEQLQTPPMYSAIKVKGKRLYEIARSGGEVERTPRKINISALECIGRNPENDYILDVRCSKGTYIRTLCNDIGEKLGCGACMSSLRRVEAGCFNVSQAHTLDEIQRCADEGSAEKLLLPVDSLFKGIRRCTVSSKPESKLRCGNQVRTTLPAGDYLVYSESGEFLLLGKVEDGLMKTVKSFFEVK